MAATWTEYGLLSGFVENPHEPPEVPEGAHIAEAWHWLNLPKPTGAPVELGGEATYVLRFPSEDAFRDFLPGFAKAYAEPNDDRGLAELRISRFYFDEPRVARDTSVTVVAFAPPKLVKDLVRLAGTSLSNLDAVGAPMQPGLRRCLTDGTDRTIPECSTEVSRVMAIVDTDIAWAHWRFRRSVDATRIGYFWDMDADCITEQNLAVGREMFGDTVIDSSYDRSIDDFLAGQYTDGSVDEMAIYRAYQDWAYRDLGRARAIRAASHGTHILDCAAGAEPGPGWPIAGCNDDTPILAVQLPKLAVDETHGSYLTPYVQLALDRIEYVARKLYGDDVEIVANYSFGGSAGRHDGKSELEQDFDERLAMRPSEARRLVALGLPAGNSYELRSHARVKGSEMRGEGAELTLRVLPDDGTPNLVEVWLPKDVPAKALTLIVTPPIGPPISSAAAKAAPTQAFVWELAAGSSVKARLYRQIDAWPPANSSRVKFTLVVRHTGENYLVDGFGPGDPQLAGNWSLRLISGDFEIEDDEEVMIWVERDDQLPGARLRALQSYLVPRREKDPFIHQDGTINDLATGQLTSVIAGYRRSDGKPARYASAGFKRKDGGVVTPIVVAPTVAAPSEEAPALPGINAAGTFSGSTRRLQGTSAATGLATRRTMQLSLIGGARPELGQLPGVEGTLPHFPAPAVPPIRLGAGHIHAAIPCKPPRRDT